MPECPNCGSRMVKRTARSGPNAGGQFWGCPRYPSCRGIRSLADGPAAQSRSSSGSVPPTRRSSTRSAAPIPRIESREHNLIRYYIGCIEGEGTRELVIQASGDGERFLLVSAGAERLLTSDSGDWRQVSDEPRLAAWAAKRAMASRSERLLYGYPIVVGADKGGRAFAPLFYTEVQVRVTDGSTSIRPESALVELSLFALDLLGVDRQERSATMDAVEAIDEPTDAYGRLSAKLRMLADLGVIAEGDLNLLDPSQLVVPPEVDGLTNTAMIFAGERALVTRQLIEDLEELAAQDQPALSRGPLGVLLGTRSAELPPAPAPQPAILPTNLSQDRAVTAALAREFSVVTGPPGTGKSQVLVNTVAAALEAGETVLFASKNNQAVDVVFDRLAAVSVEATPLRVGAARLRGTTSQAIRQALARTMTKSSSLAEARRDWAEMAAELAPWYRVEEERVVAERGLAAEEAHYAELADGLRSALLLIDDPQEMERASVSLEKARVLATSRIRWPVLRAKKRAQRVQALNDVWMTFRDALPPSLADGYPVALPTSGIGKIRSEVSTGCDVARQRSRVREARHRLDAIPDRWDVQESLRERDEARIRAGRRLFEARWIAKIRGAQSGVRTNASSYADSLGNLSQGKGGSAGKLRASIPGILAMFPIWGVTNLSARTNLPLISGLFDLVVIDEASQCDIASALPLLFRGKRALIIGDRNQLIHVSTLPRSQEQALAGHHELEDDDALSMGYRSTSLFGLSARRVGEDPIFLEEHYRSHRAIITFSNDLFYGSRLIVLTDEGQALDGPAVNWVDVPGTFARGPRGSSVLNAPEAQAVTDLVSGFASDAWLSVGVVSPYRAQVEAIRGSLHHGSIVEGLTVDTAHRFQGDERDVVVFSPTVSTSMPSHFAKFANDPNLVNVSVTRARRQLWIVGDREACRALGGVLGHLATYVSDLEDGRFESPIERRLFDALVQQGIPTEPAVETHGYRIDLAVVNEGMKLDIECDGAASHQERRIDAIRDAQLRDAGWTVLRFSGRQINGDVEACVRVVLEAMAASKSATRSPNATTPTSS